MGTLTSYLEVARPFYQTSQCGIVLQTQQKSLKEEEEILANQEAIGEAAGNTEEEELRKKNLALKVTGKMMRLFVLFMCLF